jgi:hypothetical protein
LSFFTFNTAKSCKNWIVTLFFLRKTPKTEKSPKLAEISDHSIYPWSGLTHTPFIVLRGKMLHFQRSTNLCILKRGIYVDNKCFLCRTTPSDVVQHLLTYDRITIIGVIQHRKVSYDTRIICRVNRPLF